MLIAARNAMMVSNKKIPALWWGDDTSYFDSGITLVGEIDIEVEFYRKVVPTGGQYIMGSQDSSSYRFDPCVYTSTFWFFSIGGATQNNYFSTGGALLYNRINKTLAHYDLSGSTKTATFTANGYTFPSISSNVISELTPYIGARNYPQGTVYQPAHNVGIISIKIWQNGNLIKNLKPYQNGSAATFKEMVSNVVMQPLSGQNNLTYIPDITKDGVILDLQNS